MDERNSDSRLWNADIRLFETGNLSDATITCGDRTWNVHKVILSSRCKWFKAAFYGNMAEATSGRIVLYEQKPELINILLRFIYARDTEYHIERLKQGADIPSLCVEVFRVADFFLVDELKEVATQELKAYFEFDVPVYDADELPDEVQGMDQTPVWLTEISDAVEEAYKDRSTRPILKTLLELIFERRHLIFCFEAAVALLERSPDMAKDFMKHHLIGDFTKRQTEFRIGLTVLKATQSSTRTYIAGSEDSTSHEDDKLPSYLLYPTKRKQNIPFILVHPQTEREQTELQWITPAPGAVKKMTTHHKSPLVLVTMNHGKASLGIKFDACGDARLYVEFYCRRNPAIEDLQAANSESLARLMPKQFVELS